MNFILLREMEEIEYQLIYTKKVKLVDKWLSTSSTF